MPQRLPANAGSFFSWQKFRNLFSFQQSPVRCKTSINIKLRYRGISFLVILREAKRIRRTNSLANYSAIALLWLF